MDYLLEVSRIIDGATKGDKAKVEAYANQLISKLRRDGHNKAADRLYRTITANQNLAATASLPGPKRLPVDAESRLALADEASVAPEDVDIVLEPVVERRVAEFVQYIGAADKLLANDVGMALSMLMYGPPGVGKTELARYIAGQLGLPLLTVRSDSLISSFLGSTSKNIRMLFEHAESRPCILFLDEFDAIGKLRDDQRELGELKRVVISLLQNIDSLSKQTVLLAATNHPHLLDTAVWRRFSYKLELVLPGESSRLRLFALFLRSYSLQEKQTSLLARLSETLTGADIRYICEDAIRAAILADSPSVDSVSILREVIQIRLGRQIDFDRMSSSDIDDIQTLTQGILTQKMLAEIFCCAPSTISRHLHGKVSTNAKREQQSRETTADKGDPHAA